VFLKHLIKGKSTDNRLSCHLVKINPGCEIGIHNHVGKTELHEILSGFGHCMIEQKEFDYHKGVIGFIPADKNHSIKAENEGLFLLAKFFPALL
jgi:quercetin dioxygenase-like cupin family protein